MLGIIGLLGWMVTVGQYIGHYLVVNHFALIIPPTVVFLYANWFSIKIFRHV